MKRAEFLTVMAELAKTFFHQTPLGGRPPPGAFLVLARIALADERGERLSQSDVARDAGLSQSVCQRVCAWLDGHHLIRHVRSESDGRKLWCVVTRHGHEELDKLYAVMRASVGATHRRK